MKRFELTTRGHSGAEFNIKCMNHNGFSGVGISYNEVEVQGRDFPLIRNNHTRKRFTLEVEIIVDSPNIQQDIANIKKWLLTDISDEKIQLSNIPGYYFKGFLDNKLDIGEVIGQVGECTLKFNCQPYLMLEGGDDFVTLEDNSKLNNTYGVESKPLIKINSTGDVKFSIGSDIVELRDTNGILYLDSELMDAYMIDTTGKIVLQNYKMYTDFPKLKPGELTYKVISGTIQEFSIMPRWRVI